MRRWPGGPRVLAVGPSATCGVPRSPPRVTRSAPARSVQRHRVRRPGTGSASACRAYNQAGSTVPSASSPRLKPGPILPNQSTSPSTGSAGTRSSVDSPTSSTSPTDCLHGTPNGVSEPHRIGQVAPTTYHYTSADYQRVSRCVTTSAGWLGPRSRPTCQRYRPPRG
jgi:hypothetical protein